MKTITKLYANGVFCQEESDSSPLANGAAAELRAEGPSVLAACSAGAGSRTHGGSPEARFIGDPVQPVVIPCYLNFSLR